MPSSGPKGSLEAFDVDTVTAYMIRSSCGEDVPKRVKLQRECSRFDILTEPLLQQPHEPPGEEQHCPHREIRHHRCGQA